MVRFVNNLKTVILLGGLMGLCLAVGSMFGQHGLILGLMFGGIMNLVAWFFSDKIALAAMQAKEVTPADGGVAAELYHMVDDLRQRANLPMPRVYICPQAAPNAFATGRSPSKAAVAVTQGALQILNYDELKGVMAHELAHVKNRDTLTSCIAAMVAGTLAYLAQMGLWFGGGNNREGGNPLFGLLALILAPIGAAVIQAMISRSREYVADADGDRWRRPRADVGSAQARVPLGSDPHGQPEPRAEQPVHRRAVRGQDAHESVCDSPSDGEASCISGEGSAVDRRRDGGASRLTG
jgi:heat shock protein HtpX